MAKLKRDFEDLLAANREYAKTFSESGFDGIARAGVLVVTCMDSRILPTDMLGLKLGDAKILRTPGGRITDDAVIGCVLGVHLLHVHRILVVPHTRCAVGSGDDAMIAAKVKKTTGADLSGAVLGCTPDQMAGLSYDVRRLRSHPLLKDMDLEIGGFMYDVDTGLLTQHH